MATAIGTRLSKRFSLRAAALAALLLALALAGCGISVNKDERAGKKRVDIESPFGGVHVRTDIDAAKETGIPVYPGARPKHDRDSDRQSANVNIGSSLFGIKVVAAAFETDDPPEKVLDFYRKELKNYGSVLECDGNDRQNVKPGESKALSCGDEEDRKINIGVGVLKGSGTRLKVGTTDHQHVVEVKPHGSGTEFGLVYLQTRGKGESM